MNKKILQTLPIIFLPIVSYMLLGPLEIYFGNQKDFNFVYNDFFCIFCILAILLLIGFSLLISILPNRIGKGINTIILAWGVGSYIQNMFMNIKLTEVDGSPMNWNELGYFPIINIFIWIIIFVLIIAVSIFFSKYWATISTACSSFLCAIQLIAVLSLVLTAPHNESMDNLEMSGEKQFKVAQKNNIIIFVLDTFGNTQLDTAIAQHPDILEGLKDFTYYNNADCHYYCTFPSMTNMLTGNEFDFNAISQEWMHASWASDKAITFYQELHNKNYTCNLYSSDIGYVYGSTSNLAGKFDNIVPVEKEVNHYKLTSLLFEMSVYRYVPYIIKPYFEVLTHEFNEVITYLDGMVVLNDNGDFYRQLVSQSLSVDTEMENALILQHLSGTHLPYTLNEEAITVSESSLEQTIQGLMVIIQEYLQQLIQLGAYEESTIIITADHGSWYGNDPQPIFFIKLSNESHDSMQITTTPISLDDFQATILDIIDTDYTEFGTSIWDWTEGSTRERTVYMRMNDKAYSDVKGSSFNVYYKYSYSTDKAELIEKMGKEPDEIIPATMW